MNTHLSVDNCYVPFVNLIILLSFLKNIVLKITILCYKYLRNNIILKYYFAHVLDNFRNGSVHFPEDDTFIIEKRCITFSLPKLGSALTNYFALTKFSIKIL